MNKFKAVFISALVLISMSAISAPKVYGKLNIAVNNDGSDGVNEQEIDLVSNASRLGFKGKVDMKNGLTGIYQIEYQVDITNDNTKGKTFDQRNSFVGLKGSFGTLKIGTHDTPLKLAQLKADLFNDLKGDIKNVHNGENRIGSFFGYDSPTFGGGVSIHVGVGKGKDDMPNSGEFGDNVSVSLKYDIDVIKFAIATEQDSIKGNDNTRLGMMIPAGPVTLGLIYTTTEESNGTYENDATTFSIAGKVADGKGKVKFQYGTSDYKGKTGLSQTQIGYDHKLFKGFKILAYHTIRTEDAADKDVAHTGVGFEYKF